MSANLEAQTESHLNRLLSQTPSMLQMSSFLRVAVTHDIPVLLTGETGTGKTYLARLIHDCSPRAGQPLLVISCGALVPNLVESELFGHVRGAFTGADKALDGKFAVASQGTVLMDEIDTLGLTQQAALLRIIDTGEYEPVGSTQTQCCTARMIFATNVNLDEAVRDNQFRVDLYYRINVLSFYLPPLRERPEDILPLAEGAVARACQKFHKQPMAVSGEARTALEAYPWPGNIRQLENVIQNAVLFGTGAELLLKHLPQPIQEYAGRGPLTPIEKNGSLGRNCEQHERNLIHRTLVNCDFNCTEAARTLKVSRTTLYKKIKKYGLMDGAGLAEEAPSGANDLALDVASGPQRVRQLMRATRYRHARRDGQGVPAGEPCQGLA